MMRSIILVGFMGSGKTSLGEVLKEKTGMKLIDTDSLIEEAEGRSINDIFKAEGEEYFRKLESEALKKISLSEEAVIISTGGGAVLADRNIPLLMSCGEVVYLRTKPETIVKRLKDDNSRPLLKTDNKEEKIREILKNREGRYVVAADIIIDTDDCNITELADTLLNMLEKF